MPAACIFLPQFDFGNTCLVQINTDDDGLTLLLFPRDDNNLRYERPSWLRSEPSPVVTPLRLRPSWFVIFTLTGLMAGVTASPQDSAINGPTAPASPLPGTVRGLTAADEAVLALQVGLDRHGFSPGSIDGVAGAKTTSALNAWLTRSGLSPGATAAADALRGTAPLFTKYAATSNDLLRLQPVAATWVGKSQQDRLDYETLDELVAEKSHSSPGLIRRLNPDVDWSRPMAGAVLNVPAIFEEKSEPRKAAFVRIYLEDRVLQAFDDKTNVLVHFPCSIAQQMSQRPVGELRVAVAIPNPNYTFDPAMFKESAEARALDRKLIIPPGPNNPVGTVWIGLDRPGYGIHGTPRPEQVGRAESHGCFRLANWNAERLLPLVWISMPVYILDGRQPVNRPPENPR